MDEKEIMFDVAEEAHKEMLLSGFKKAIHPAADPMATPARY